MTTESKTQNQDTADIAKSEPLQIALVKGEVYSQLPKDLYIPPDALEVFLEQFEGPLDLLLYLIKKQNLDILDIPIVNITKQYMEYIDLMKDMRLELAAEYLVMAAMLAEIKSRMLLPRPPIEDEDDIDPRAELIRRLQEYERYRKAADEFENMDRMGRDVLAVSVVCDQEPDKEKPLPKLELDQLLKAFSDVLKRAEMFTRHHIEMEALSVRERMSQVLSRVKDGEFAEFTTLFDVTEGRMGVVVTFLAILELIKESLLEIVQSEAFAQIHIKAAPGMVSADDDSENEAENDAEKIIDAS